MLLRTTQAIASIGHLGIAPVLEKTLEVATAFFPIAKLDLKEAQVVEGHHV